MEKEYGSLFVALLKKERRDTMSQTMRIPKINDSFYGEILTYFPDEEEAQEMVKEAMTDGCLSEYGDYEVTTDWYEIGEGESDTDYFFSDEELIEWYNVGGIEEIEKRAREKGLDVEHIQTDTVYVSAEDIDMDSKLTTLKQ